MNIQTIVFSEPVMIAVSDNTINVSVKHDMFSVYIDNAIMVTKNDNVTITKEKLSNGKDGYIVRYKEKNIIEITI